MFHGFGDMGLQLFHSHSLMRKDELQNNLKSCGVKEIVIDHRLRASRVFCSAQGFGVLPGPWWKLRDNLRNLH